MERDSEPTRVYYFSDTFGGDNSDPLKSPDPDAYITTDIRAHPGEKLHREFDIFDNSGVTDHILRAICRLHRGVRRAIGVTGVVINSAPRTEEGKNGDDFHLAYLSRGNVRVVAPLHVLSSVKGEVAELRRLPNEGNGLYESTEQFRSSFVGALFHPNHGIELADSDPSQIPDYPKGHNVSYVDRFGNLVTHATPPESLGLPLRVDQSRGVFRVKIGDVMKRAVGADCLGNARSTGFSIYRNDGDVEVVWKWANGESPRQRHQQSAYVQFGRPVIGTPVEITSL